jgi:high-affinity nickel permease
MSQYLYVEINATYQAKIELFSLWKNDYSFMESITQIIGFFEIKDITFLIVAFLIMAWDITVHVYQYFGKPHS